jgi:gamma-glutamyltranspeptidase/glutathione hydrolase
LHPDDSKEETHALALSVLLCYAYFHASQAQNNREMSPHGPQAQFAIGEKFAVVTGCHEATESAMDVMRKGGNVVDAALTASAVLCVALPQAVSIGGDLFALVKMKDAAPAAINATGAAPRAATIDAYRSRGLKFVPTAGPLSTQTPGLVAGWQLLADNWASWPLARLLDPAKALASSGVRVTERLAHFIAGAAPEYGAYPGFADLFSQDGRLLHQGDLWKQQNLARTLDVIANEGAEGFYHGWIAEDIARTTKDAGGLLEASDFETVSAQKLDPLSVRFRNFNVWTQPPVSQGVILLRALRILMANADKSSASDAPDYWRKALAALRIAFRERLALLGDKPAVISIAEKMIKSDPVLNDGPDDLLFANHGTETTILSVMDTDGNVASIIQSVFADLGAGVVGHESGVLMNNRLSAFFLDPSHPNALSPGKRSMHTLHNFMVTDDQGVCFAGGSPGGDLQPQVNLQLIARMIDLNQSPSQTVSAPRWAMLPGTIPLDLSEHSMPYARIDPELSSEMRKMLTEFGMRLVVSTDHNVGSAKLVGKTDHGLGAWCDQRRDSLAAAE